MCEVVCRANNVCVCVVGLVAQLRRLRSAAGPGAGAGGEGDRRELLVQLQTCLCEFRKAGDEKVAITSRLLDAVRGCGSLHVSWIIKMNVRLIQCVPVLRWPTILFNVCPCCAGRLSYSMCARAALADYPIQCVPMLAGCPREHVVGAEQ